MHQCPQHGPGRERERRLVAEIQEPGGRPTATDVPDAPAAPPTLGPRLALAARQHPRRLAPRPARRRPDHVHLPAPVRTALRLQRAVRATGTSSGSSSPPHASSSSCSHLGVGLLRPHVAPREHRRSRAAARRGRWHRAAPRAHVHVGHRASAAHRARRRADPRHLPVRHGALPVSDCSPSGASAYPGLGRTGRGGRAPAPTARPRCARCARRPMLGLVPVVVVDDDPALRSRSIHGVPIAGSVDDLARDRRRARRPPDPARDRRRRRRRSCSRSPTPPSRPASRCACCARRRRGSTACRGCATCATSTSRTCSAASQVDIDLEPVRQAARTGGACSSPAAAAGSARRSPARSPSSDPARSCSSTTTRPTSTTRSRTCAASRPRSRSPTSATASVVETVFADGAARGRVPRRRAQARADPRGLRLRSDPHQRLRHAQRRRRLQRASAPRTSCASPPTRPRRPPSVMGASKWLAEQIVLARAAARRLLLRPVRQRARAAAAA